MVTYMTPKCPKCNLQMEDWGMPMTHDEFEEFRRGKNQAYKCPKCPYHKIYDFSNSTNDIDWQIATADNIGPKDFSMNIDFPTVEDLITRAIDKRCFIEVISLVYNIIELYLKSELIKFWHKILQAADFNISIEKRFDKIIYIEELFEKIIVPKKEHLKDYLDLCRDLNLIEPDMYTLITNFNRQRNTMIHNLLKTNGSLKYVIEVRETAKIGREIQLKLSPLQHTEKEIQSILLAFEIRKEEKENDIFLR